MMTENDLDLLKAQIIIDGLDQALCCEVECACAGLKRAASTPLDYRNAALEDVDERLVNIRLLLVECQKAHQVLIDVKTKMTKAIPA